MRKYIYRLLTNDKTMHMCYLLDCRCKCSRSIVTQVFWNKPKEAQFSFIVIQVVIRLGIFHCISPRRQLKVGGKEPGAFPIDNANNLVAFRINKDAVHMQAIVAKDEVVRG